MLYLVDSDNLKHGTRYPDAVKENAFQLWCYLASRNAAEVSRMLASGEHCESVQVPRETVAYWAREHNWADRATSELAQILPDAQAQTVATSILGARAGMAYLRRVADGLEDEPDISDILENKDIDLVDKRLRIDARVKSHDAARKARIAAVSILVDRSGLHPSGKSNPMAIALTARRQRGDVQGMTDDQIAERESQLGDGR